MSMLPQDFLKTLLPSALTGLLALAAAPALANDAQTLARNNQCMSCHKVDGKTLGPSFKEVAAKDKGDPEAMGRLSQVVRAGGKGVWGVVPMPPHTSISDDDLTTVVNWILAQDS
jgi:cytochrome c